MCVKKRSKLNLIYQSMVNRCCNPNCKAYKNYGGRGITVCEEWLNNSVIVVNNVHGSKGWFAFKDWALSHNYSEGLTIDRIDNNGGYCPSNCQWVSRKIQGNNKRNNRLITYNGRTQTFSQWCEELEINPKTMKSRLDQSGWSIDRAFSQKGNATVKLITYKGITKSVSDWCKVVGLPSSTVYHRLDRGWSVEKALETKGV